MKKELKMKHIFIPVLVIVIVLGIVAAVLSKQDNTVTPTDAGVATSHTHADGEVHYEEH